MKDNNLQDKLIEIYDAVKTVKGINVTGVEIDTDVHILDQVAQIIPRIMTLELIVKIGLKLEAEEE